MINKHKSNKIKENSNTVRHLNNGTDHRHSKSCCDQSSPARRTIRGPIASYVRCPSMILERLFGTRRSFILSYDTSETLGVWGSLRFSLTLLVLGTGYPRQNESSPWLLMPWWVSVARASAAMVLTQFNISLFSLEGELYLSVPFPVYINS